MKKIVASAVCLLFIFTLTACGFGPNNAMVSKINKSINNVKKTLEKTQEINEADFMSQEILDYQNDYTQTFFPAGPKLQTKDDEFVQAKQANKPQSQEAATQQEAQKNAKNKQEQDIYNQENTSSNIDTYFYNNLPRNTNTYFLLPNLPPQAYGMNGMGYGGGFGYGRPYGAGFAPGFDPRIMKQNTGNFNNPANPGLPNAINYNQARRKRVSNVDTYGLNTTNVNTYKTAGEQESESRKKTPKNNANRQYNNFDYVNYHISKENQLHIAKLSNFFNAAYHLINVNIDVLQEKTRLNYIIESLKQVLDEVKKSENALTDAQKKSVNMLIENIESHLTKIQLSKNELKYELGKIKEIKEDFLKFYNELSARYIVLANFLDTRYSYYSNIANCLEQLKQKLIGETTPQEKIELGSTNNTNKQMPNSNNKEKQEFNLEQKNAESYNTSQQNSFTDGHGSTPQNHQNQNTQNNGQIKNNNNQTFESLEKPSPKQSQTYQNDINNEHLLSQPADNHSKLAEDGSRQNNFNSNETEQEQNLQPEQMQNQQENCPTIYEQYDYNNEQYGHNNNEKYGYNNEQYDHNNNEKYGYDNEQYDHNNNEVENQTINGFKDLQTPKTKVSGQANKFEPVPNKKIDDMFNKIKRVEQNNLKINEPYANTAQKPSNPEKSQTKPSANHFPFKNPKKKDFLKVEI